jgi:NAD(P)-dependent dehydrogenase (short-subunit alcohol dehydrogenase family)
MDHPLKENVVILTGASSGIGRALALELANSGAFLVLAARSRGALETVASECVSRGGRAIVQTTDVTDDDQCRALVDRTVSEHGRIDTLIHDAGVSMWARFAEVQDFGIFERIMRVNYFGAVALTRYALPWLLRTRGRLAAVSSVAGLNGVPTRSGYSASKHALVGFFDSLRIELAPEGVTVTILCPDFVKSEIRERCFGPDGKPLGPGNSPVREDVVMTAEECARISVRAIARRDREVLMSPRSRVGLWLKLIAPGVVDRIAARAIARGR